MKRLLALALLACLTSVAFASGSVTNLTITNTEVSSSGYFYITYSGSISGGPTCASGNGAIMVVDGTTSAGKVLVSALLMWFITGKTVTGQGTGACSVDSRYETISYLQSTD